MDLTGLLCDHAASTGEGRGSTALAHKQFEPRPGYVYGMDGKAGFKEQCPDVPPIVLSPIIRFQSERKQI